MANSSAAREIGCPECRVELGRAVGEFPPQGCDELSIPGRPPRHRPAGHPVKALRSYVEVYGRLVAPAVFNTDVVE